MRGRFVLSLLITCLPMQLLGATPFDAAKAFGARPGATGLTLSPDGTKVAYIAPDDGPGYRVFAIDLTKKTHASLVMRTDGNPLRVTFCDWVTNNRLVCRLEGRVRDPVAGLAPLYRLIAVDADGTNLKVLSNQINSNTRGYLVRQDQVIDWLPDQDGVVLMMREYAPDAHIGSRIGSEKRGLGVDLVDTRTLSSKEIEPPQRDVSNYLTDGRGNVRIMGIIARDNRGIDKGFLTFYYHKAGSHEWQKLGEYNAVEHEGFVPESVDPTLDVAYGFKQHDGHRALYTVSLDGSLHEEIAYARPDADMTGLIQIHRQVIGVSYGAEERKEHFLDPEIGGLFRSLREAVTQPSLGFVESSTDSEHNTMLFFGSGSTDPGVYYVFDRKTKHLDTFLVARSELEGVKLPDSRSIDYPAADGTRIRAYLTLPLGRESAKGLPAIVLPPWGESRDASGFIWFARFFAARGYAVLRPEFRGTTAGDTDWRDHEGFKSWSTVVSDVNDAGRWLVSQGIANPQRLAIVGWHYGGYAALQSAVVDPGLFKAIVAIAPMSDLSQFRDEFYGWSTFATHKAAVGDGPQLHAGSPIEHVDRIAAPVLLFHGDLDRDVAVDESKRFAARLTAAGKNCSLTTFADLDEDLVDSGARTRMLRSSDEFLRKALGLDAQIADTPPH